MIYTEKECIHLGLYVNKLHWLQWSADGNLEMFLDNHMMQTFRACEARFWNDFVEGYTSPGRTWFLDLGTCVHKMIELYYINRERPSFSLDHWAINIGSRIWYAKKMDFYATHPIWASDYKKLNGREGFCILLLQYAKYFSLENERLRVIGTELYFGKSKEVPLTIAGYEDLPFSLYLSGKIDLLLDDGVSIGPMDHKTTKDFRGKNPLVSYEVQEGMTGYVYAAQHLVRRFPELQRRECNKIWMNFLQIKEEKIMHDRFKRLPLFKTGWQLEQYRQRMLRTASRIHSLLLEEKPNPDWNTMMCTNWMHGTCSLQEVHRQGSEDSQLIKLNSNFVKAPIWNPETIDEEENKVLQIVKEEEIK